MKPSQLIKIFFIALLFFNLNVYAQNFEKLTLTLPQTKISNSLYNKVTLIDLRPDTVSLGIIQTGAFNRVAIVVTKEPLQQQISNILTALTDNTAKSQELVLQLRYISFAEMTGGFSEKGYFLLKAQLYAKADDGYRKINTIDTVATISSAIDVSNALLKKGSETLSNFIAANLKRKPSNYSYSYNDVVKVDSIEKSKLPVYNTNIYADGLYLTYKTFAEQTPDMKIIVEGDEIEKNNVKATDETGKLKKVKSGTFFAIVYKGVPYVSTSSGYYKLNKNNDDFFFNGKVEDVLHSSSTTAMSGMMFGALGGAIAGAISAASASNDSKGEFKVSYQDGRFIKVR